jgi:DNA-binding response OmpR family regulator
VLLVEDDGDLRRLFRTALSLAMFTVHEARDGFEAIRRLDVDPPDIVVLDLMMPGLDGFAVRRELEANAHTRNIPVVIVTSLPADEVAHLNVECVLTKPVMPQDLVAAVRRCLASAGGSAV